MLTPDAVLKALAALVSATFALLIFGARSGRNVQRWLGTFLLLIALNQAAEAWRAIATDPGTKLIAFRLASVFAAADPFYLFYFVGSFPEFSPLRRNAPVALVGAISTVFIAFAVALPALPPESNLFSTGLDMYTVAVYLFVAVWTLRHPAPGNAWPPMTAALLCAALPKLASGMVGVIALATAPNVPPTRVLVGSGLGFTALATVILLLATRERRRDLSPGFAVAIALVVLTKAGDIRVMLTGDPNYSDTLRDIGRSAASVRWLAFGALMSMAVLREDAFAMSLASRRRAARLLIGLALLTTVAFVAALVDPLIPGGLGLQPLALLLLLALLAATQSFHRLVDETAKRVFNVPLPGDMAARTEAYRAAAAHAAAEGRDPARDARLQLLREELGIETGVARVIEAVADRAVRAGVSPGHIVAGRYHVTSPLGRGGGGRAFAARDEVLQRDVVLKEVVGTEDDDVGREARTAARVRHPNVLTIFDVLQRGDSVILVTERARDGSLDQWIAREGPLPPERGIPLLVEIAQGLAAVHDAGLVHRDIKPGNIFLDGGHPKIGDFGVAVAKGAMTVDLRATGGVGTPDYMSPEQLRGEKVGAASDVFALGVLARRCLRSPLPPEVEAIVERATRPAPADRYPSAREMLDALSATRLGHAQ